MRRLPGNGVTESMGTRSGEPTGVSVSMVRNGTIYTPPSTEGALESITLDII